MAGTGTTWTRTTITVRTGIGPIKVIITNDGVNGPEYEAEGSNGQPLPITVEEENDE